MMGITLDAFLEQQYRLERRYKAFLSSLNANRTTTLREVLDGSKSVHNCEWLQPELLNDRLRNMVNFFNDIPSNPRVRGLENLPLMFFQSVNEAEDLAEFARRKQQCDFFNEQYSCLPPEIMYLFSSSNFTSKLKGAEGSKNREIMNLMVFSSYGQHQPIIVGILVPDYSKLLYTNQAIATDYLARTIIHDLGHSFLPSVGFMGEPLHTVTMIWAMGIKEKLGNNDWEKFIHAECTNPFFFLEASDYIGKATRRGAVEEQIITEASRTYLTPRYRHSFEIKPDFSLEEAKLKVTNKIATMVANGFEDYTAD